MASAALATDPSGRYEIRQLTNEDIPWASAILCHSNLYHSPVWPKINPEFSNVDSVRKLHAACADLVQPSIESGMSFGAFDTQYSFQRPESAKTNGALYWDDAPDNATPEEIEDRMDFPLVSVAMAYDQWKPLDFSKLADFFAIIPFFATGVHIMDEFLDKRDPNSWSAKGPKEVLMRTGTSTRHSCEGKGVMRWLAHWLMRNAAGEGYRLISADSFNGGMKHVWTHPPEPFKAEVVCSFRTDEWEEEGLDGNKIKPYANAKETVCRIALHLK
jgi:hypothetical protein